MTSRLIISSWKIRYLFELLTGRAALMSMLRR